MVLAWLGMEQLVERKINVLCMARLSLLCTKHNRWGFHLFDGGLPFLVLFWKHHRGFIAYPPAPLSTTVVCYRETVVIIFYLFFVRGMFASSLK